MVTNRIKFIQHKKDLKWADKAARVMALYHFNLRMIVHIHLHLQSDKNTRNYFSYYNRFIALINKKTILNNSTSQDNATGISIYVYALYIVHQ